MNAHTALLVVLLAVPCYAQTISVQTYAPPRVQACLPGEQIEAKVSADGVSVFIVCTPPYDLHGHGKGPHPYVGLQFDNASCQPWLLWFTATPDGKANDGYAYIYCQIDGAGKP